MTALLVGRSALEMIRHAFPESASLKDAKPAFGHFKIFSHDNVPPTEMYLGPEREIQDIIFLLNLGFPFETAAHV